MFLRNESETVTVIINTVVGKIGISPKEVIDINHRIFPPLSRHLKAVTEKEYLQYQQEKNASKVIIPDEKDDNIPTDLSEQEAKSFMETILQMGTLGLLNQTNDEKDGEQTEGEGGEQGQEIPVPQPTTTIVTGEISEPLTVTTTTETSVLDDLQKQIDDLQQTWLVTTQAKKKEKIHKDIKKLQKQLDKLKKNS